VLKTSRCSTQGSLCDPMLKPWQIFNAPLTLASSTSPIALKKRHIRSVHSGVGDAKNNFNSKHPTHCNAD
jgi:hypothetical protein